MKYLLHLSVMCLLWISYGISAHAKNKVVLSTHNLCPYGCYSEDAILLDNSNFIGLAADVVKCVFNKMDVPLEIVVVPWARAQRMVKNDQADGFFAASQKSTRDEFAVMSSIIAEQKWTWYLLLENSLNPVESNFKKKAIVGGFIGSNMLKWMEESGYRIGARPLNSERLLKMLLGKRVDAILANDHVMEALLQSYGLKNRIKTFVSNDKPLGVYFSKTFLAKRPLFLAEFNRHIPSCVSPTSLNWPEIID